MRSRLEDFGRIYDILDKLLKNPSFSYSEDEEEFAERYATRINDIKDELREMLIEIKNCWLICRGEDELNRWVDLRRYEDEIDVHD